MMQVLVLDIGNSDAVLATFGEGKLFQSFRWNSKENNSLEKVISQFETLVDLDLDGHVKVVISSVVPHLNQYYLEFFKENTKAEIILINPAKQDFLKINTDNPEQLGPDLYINALMAHQIFPENHTVVVDFGTALTFTVVSNKGELLGVSIVPGIKTAIKALFDNATMLPEVKLAKPKSVIGTDTVTAIQSGIVYGYEGLLQNIMAKLYKELGAETKFIATGGLSVFADMFSVKFDLVNKNLTLEGLYYYSSLG
jgi:type III pantothenate kinase